MRKILGIAALIALFAGCVTSGVQPPKTQLQIREFQTREFDTKNVKMVVKALLNVLQDEGFIVRNAEVELGFLSASKETDIEKSGDVFWARLGDKQNPRWNKTKLIEGTANVSEYGDKCRVRVSFQEKILDNMGAVVKVMQVDDEKFYQDFFSKVDKGIFLQKEKL